MIRVSRDKEGIVILQISRPKAMNALNKSIFNRLEVLFSDELKNDNTVKGVIITGEGKSFVAGADIKEFQGLESKEAERLSMYGQSAFGLIENFPKPVLSMLNGYALGGGMELALASHIIIAEDNALLGFPEVALGLIPGYGGTVRLSKRIGHSRANQLIMTGEKISAEKSEKWGLVNEMVQSGKGMDRANQLMKMILRNAPLSINFLLGELKENTSFELEATIFGRLTTSNDFKEGVEAFIEKRKANFSGE